MSEAAETDALLPPASTVPNNGGDDDDDEYATRSSSMFQSLKQSTISHSTGAVDALIEVKDAFRDHVMEALEGDDFFLTMSLTKNLSLLPSKPELTQAVEEVQEEFGALKRSLSLLPKRSLRPQQQPDEAIVEPEDYETSPPLSAYLTLGSAVCALSSIGPFLAKQLDVDATLKIVWRFQGTAILLAPLAIHSIIVDGIPNLSWAQWGTFFMAATSYSVLCVAFAMSIDYTTVANATILTNSQSVMLVAVKLCVGQQVLFLEAIGVSVAFLGGILAAREAAGDEDAPAQGWWSVYGDFLGLVSSVGGIGYIVLGKSLRAHFPVLLFMVLNMLTASFIIIAWMYALEKEVSWDRDYHHGVFGWMNLDFDRLPLEIMTVFVCNVLGTLGYVRAFKYFSSVIIAVAALLEPVVAAFTATAMGVGVLPGVEGWIGNFLVIVGTLAVLYPTTPQYQAEQLRKQKLAQEAQTETPRTPFPRMRTPRLQRPTKETREQDEEARERRLGNLREAAYGKRALTSNTNQNRVSSSTR